MSRKHYHIVGAPAFAPSAPPRLEFSNFAEDKDVLNLYLLALASIQNDDKENKLTSFFQIGGIHGKPPIPWDDVQGISAPKFTGYCTHGSVIFPTWHRPYVTLYEQVIWNRASSIASSYTDQSLKNKYETALKRLRQPYWDWAANAIPHPLISTEETVTVTDAPEGNKKEIKNPLFSYHFQTIHESFTGRFALWHQTLRWPTDRTENAQSQPELFIRAMETRQAQLCDSTFNLLANRKDWMTFSNTSNSGPGISIESIHNLVHNLIGEDGNMGSVEMAGFDPIFYLHHTNVDRLLSLWQALYPNIWVTPGSSNGGSFTIEPGQTVNNYSALTPFHSDDINFVNSETCRNVNDFGYTYPEINFPYASPEELKDHVTKAVLELYGPGPMFDSSTAATTQSLAGGKTPVEGEPLSSENNPPNPGHTELSQGSSTYPSRYRDWYAEVTVNQYQFKSSGYVHIFLSETVPSDNWLFSPDCVGDIAIFRNTSGECANCDRREAAGEEIIGQVPLTRALLKKGLDINDVDNLVEYFKTHLHWRCELVDGSELLLEEVASLRVKLCSALCERSVQRDGSEGFPIRQEPVTYHSVTHGRLGGYYDRES